MKDKGWIDARVTKVMSLYPRDPHHTIIWALKETQRFAAALQWFMVPQLSFNDDKRAEPGILSPDDNTDPRGRHANLHQGPPALQSLHVMSAASQALPKYLSMVQGLRAPSVGALCMVCGGLARGPQCTHDMGLQLAVPGGGG